MSQICRYSRRQLSGIYQENREIHYNPLSRIYKGNWTIKIIFFEKNLTLLFSLIWCSQLLNKVKG